MSDNENDRMSLSDHEEPPNEVQEDDEEGGQGRRVDPSTSKKKIIRRAIPKLDAARLMGPKGIQTIENYFEGFKFHGKNCEKQDLDRIMKRLEHWGHRLFPKYRFDDLLEKIEALGSKRELQVFMTKYRRNTLLEDVEVEEEEKDEEEKEDLSEPIDEFDALIAEQIMRTKKLDTPTPAPPSQLPPDVQKKIEMNRQKALAIRAAKALEAQKRFEALKASGNEPARSVEKPVEEPIVNIDWPSPEKEIISSEPAMEVDETSWEHVEEMSNTEDKQPERKSTKEVEEVRAEDDGKPGNMEISEEDREITELSVNSHEVNSSKDKKDRVPEVSEVVTVADTSEAAPSPPEIIDEELDDEIKAAVNKLVKDRHTSK